MIRCFQLVPNFALSSTRVAERELIASVQFHTCAITKPEVIFTKFDLDYAYDGKKVIEEINHA